MIFFSSGAKLQKNIESNEGVKEHEDQHVINFFNASNRTIHGSCYKMSLKFN